MKLSAKCCCGSEFTCESDSVVNDGALPDDIGRRFYVEVVMDTWQQAHKGCLPKKVEAAKDGQS